MLKKYFYKFQNIKKYQESIVKIFKIFVLLIY